MDWRLWIRLSTALVFETATAYGIWRVEWFDVFRWGAPSPRLLVVYAGDVGVNRAASAPTSRVARTFGAVLHVPGVDALPRGVGGSRSLDLLRTRSSGRRGNAGRAFPERDLEQADASVSVEHAQAHRRGSRDGAT